MIKVGLILLVDRIVSMSKVNIENLVPNIFLLSTVFLAAAKNLIQEVPSDRGQSSHRKEDCHGIFVLRLVGEMEMFWPLLMQRGNSTCSPH